MPKSEAQLKNEEAVRKVMAERGYSSASSKRKVRKTFGRSFSIKPFIVSFFVIGLSIGGWMFLQDNFFKDEKGEEKTNENLTAENSVELAEFQACLKGIDASEIALDDVEFWNKHISRYEQTIACYDNYPSVASLSEKKELQNKLAELQENSKQADANDVEYRANITRIEAEHQANMAKIDAELERNLAKIKEDGEAWDAELSKKAQERQAQSAERDAQYAKEQAEREAKRAKCNDFKSKYPDIETYRASYSVDINELYNTWQRLQAEYFKSADNCRACMAKYTHCACKTTSEMDAARDAYFSAYNQANAEYNSKYREACL